MSKFKYQNQLTSLIEWYNQGKSYADIAKLLQSDNIDRDAQAVRNLLRKHLGDIHGHPKCIITEEIKQQIRSLLDEGKKPKQISELLKLNLPTLSSYLIKEGVRFRPVCGNPYYFEVIDTFAKAYILGFIAADGSLVPAKKGSTITLTITVKYEDIDVLNFIKSELGSTHKLIEIIRPASYDSSKTIHHIRLSLSTPELIHDIMKYGITPKKSLTMGNVIENIPVQYRDAFIIGYFDGDGSIHIEDRLKQMSHGIYPSHSIYINIRGTYSFLEGVCIHLDINKNHIHQYDSIPSLNFASKKDTYRLFLCYQNLPFYYKRKYDKFLSRINHSSFDKYKQVQTISSPTT